MEDKLVVLEFFVNETEAVIAKSFLEENGITAYIFNPDRIRQFSWGLGMNEAASVRLMVGSSDLDAARELLGRKKDEKDS